MALQQQSPTPELKGIRLTMMLLAFVALAVTTLFLINNFMERRPMNLRGHAKIVAGKVEQALKNQCRLDSRRITAEEPEPRRDAKAFWDIYRFKVEVPSAMNLDGVVALLTNELTRFDIPVTRVAVPDGGVCVLIAVAGRETVEVTFKNEPPSEIPRRDFTAACKQVADQVEAAFIKAGLAATDVQRTAPESRQNDTTLYTLTTFSAVDPQHRTAQTWAEFLRENITVDDVQVAAFEAAPHLVVNVSGVSCVKVVFTNYVTDEPKRKSDAAATEEFDGTGPSDTMPEKNTSSVTQSRLPDMESAPSPNPRVAIVVDDGGYGGRYTDAILALSPVLTLAMLPDAPQVRSTARRAAKAGFEVIVHMPMESHSDGENAKYEYLLKVDMTPERIKELTERALKQVPEAVGINNHIGSRFTEDAKALAPFFDVLAQKGCYFLDSRTTPKSVALASAKETGIPSIASDLFLDNKADEDYILNQFDQLFEVAKKHGKGVGICHFRKHSANALAKALDDAKKQGIDVVHLSELIE